MLTKIKTIVLFACLSVISVSIIANPVGILKEKHPVVKDGDLTKVIKSVSSPIEMAALIKSSGVPFSIKHLCPTNKAGSYNTNFKKALGLGFLGADLGYLNIYDRKGQVLDYISEIKSLAEGLRVGQFFDFSTFKKYAVQHANIDSLMYTSINSFNQMDEYLRQTNRSDIGAVIVTGVWIEGLYHATQVVSRKYNSKIAERIGEQKVILEELLTILSDYKTKPSVMTLVNDLKKLETILKGVKIRYEQGETTYVEKDGALVAMQNDISIVTITKAQLTAIANEVKRIRNKLVVN